MVVCATISAVLMFGASASAQTSATDQYLTDEGSGEATTTTGVAGAVDTGTSGGDGTSAGAGVTSSGGATATAGGATVAETHALRLTFGAKVPKALDDEIEAALAQAGLGSGPTGEIAKSTAEDFLGTDLAKSLGGSGGAEAIGKAVAGLLLHPSAQTSLVIKALLIDPAVLTETPTHAIFTRAAAATGDFGKFQNGVVEGLSEIPTVYVELSGSTTSFVTAFDKLGVPTVDSLDTAAGKAAFGAILVSGAVGNFGTKSTADSKLTPLGVQPIAAESPGADDATLGGAMPYLLLMALVFGALVWALPAMRRGPFRRPPA